MERVLVTGASGFIGSALVGALCEPGYSVFAGHRAPLGSDERGPQSVLIGDLADDIDWRVPLEGVSAVVHLAGPAHARFGEAYLRKTITGQTAALAAAASDLGVKRFVFVSSIKAAGTQAQAVNERAPPLPRDAYGRAKLAAEEAVLAYPGVSPIVLRPPLVHGAGAKGNFRWLLRLANMPAPLPLAGLSNRRSVISLESLITAIKAVLAAPAVTGVFHVADQPALAVSDIVRAVRRGLERPDGLFDLPGLRSFAPRALTETLIVDDGAFRTAFGYGEAQEGDAAARLTATARAWKAQR